jgi:hypothetical protein
MPLHREWEGAAGNSFWIIEQITNDVSDILSKLY